VSVNGVVGSLAVTELMCAVTGLRVPHRLLRYRGSEGTVRRVGNEPPLDCFYCSHVRARGRDADVERYLRDGTNERLP
jgi:hypothetical protein